MSKDLPSETSVVVIGGGAMGCSTLYHLAERGVGDAILLERTKLTSGTTWHSAAQVRQLRSSRNLTEMIRYSANLYARLEQETGQSTGWIRKGSLSIATNADRFTHIKRQASLSRLFGLEAHVVGPEEAKALWPLLNVSDVVGAVYAPGDGRVNPSDLCLALVKGAKSRGAQVFEDCPVTGIEVQDGRARGVTTPLGSIRSDKVVNCAGLWGRAVGKLAGVSVPLYACEHFYLLTKPIEGIDDHLPTLSDHDGHLYIRDEVGGLLVGCFEPDPKPLPPTRLRDDFAFELLDEDWDHFEPMMHNALHRIPALETAEAKLLLDGPESFTPDGAFLLGEAPEVTGFFVGCGMNSMGLASAGGAGRTLADWVIDGAPPVDMWPVDIRRFTPSQADEAYLKARIPEELALHYAIHYPGREPRTARKLRKGPLYERLANKGACFGVRFGFERANYFPNSDEPRDPPLTFGKPAWFDAVARECHAARNGVAVFDQSSFGKLLIEGPDAEVVMLTLCAGNIAKPPGNVVYTHMLNERGGIETDFTVFRLAPDRYQIITGTAQPVRDAHWIRTHLGDHRATVNDNTEDLAVLSVMGPNARTLLSRLTDTDLSLAGFPLFSFRQLRLGSVLVRAARLSYIGELGWELYTPATDAGRLYDTLLESGTDLGLTDAGAFALTSLRIEKGFRSWGHDVTPDDTLLEAGLAFTVRKDTSIPFVGQAAVEAQRTAGVKRRFLFFMLRDPDVWPLGGEPILRGDQIVGQLTSAAYGHTLGCSFAMGYVALDGMTAEKAAELDYAIEIALEPHTASASLKPFFDPSGERMRR